jgi:hypothetical protein
MRSERGGAGDVTLDCDKPCDPKEKANEKRDRSPDRRVGMPSRVARDSVDKLPAPLLFLSAKFSRRSLIKAMVFPSILLGKFINHYA